MKKVQFSTPYEDRVEVIMNGDNCGTLVFDHEQNVWVLWPSTIDDGISYWGSLAETEETITDEEREYLMLTGLQELSF